MSGSTVAVSTAATDPADAKPAVSIFQPFIPKSWICLREGYGRKLIVGDLLAGLTVGVIALPLGLAFAIASHVSPERGLYTAIIAGFLISLLGGSRVQIGGPTGAFVIIIAGIVDAHGYAGLAVATVMAGMILIVLGLFQFGKMIKFIPYPVTTGFTTGIALIIFSQQMKGFFGMSVQKVPTEFIGAWTTYFFAFRHGLFNGYTAAIGLGSLGILIALRKFAPRLPGYLLAVVIATVVVAALRLDTNFHVQTIGAIPRRLPAPALPDLTGMTFATVKSLIPSATTIAILAAIESLLCAVVADGMIGGRHKSNCELVAQGVANIGSILFGGIPATGAIARTAANVKAGGRTPLAGIVHALVVLGVMLLMAPLASRIPLAALAAVLVMVAWNMSERDHFKHLLRAPRSDVAVLLTTFGLTVFADLTTAVGVGMVLASLLFMRRMSEVTNVGAFDEDEAGNLDVLERGDPNAIDRRTVPAGVEVYEIDGPFFFGVADRLQDTLKGLEKPPKVLVLRMRRVPAVDATGMHALEEFFGKCRRQGIRLLLAGVHAQPMFALAKYGMLDQVGEENLFGNVDDALNAARALLGKQPEPRPAGALPEVARERA